MKPPPDFFVSHSTLDRRWSDWIAFEIEKAGYSTIYQSWDFLPGSSFVQNMHSALESCDRMLIVLSKNYLGSQYAMAEWQAFYPNDPLAKNGRIVPILIDRDCKTSGLLRTLVYVDITDCDELTARRLLLQTLGRERQKPTGAPPFPTESSSPSLNPIQSEAQAQFPAPPTQRSPGRMIFMIVLRAVLQVLAIPLLEAILAKLRALGGDDSIGFRGAAPGSIRLVFEGTTEGVERLQRLFSSGQLVELCGHEISSFSNVSRGSVLSKGPAVLQTVASQQRISDLMTQTATRVASPEMVIQPTTPSIVLRAISSLLGLLKQKKEKEERKSDQYIRG